MEWKRRCRIPLLPVAYLPSIRSGTAPGSLCARRESSILVKVSEAYKQLQGAAIYL